MRKPMQASLSASSPRRALGILTPLLIAAVTAGAHADPPATDLAHYRNTNRLLFIFAPSANDSRYTVQKNNFGGKADGFKERDLIRFDVFENGESRHGSSTLSASEAAALRHRFDIVKGQFKVLLVGKDGHTAYSASRAISASQLFGLIDAMPMRKEEMRHQQKSAGAEPTQHKAAGKDAVKASTKVVSGETTRESTKETGKDIPKEMGKAALPNRPDKRLTPDQVVKMQMQALQHNDTPKPDSGIATTFLFASPDNKRATGPLDHFAQIVKSEAYLPMLNCKSITYDPVLIDGDMAEQRVHIVSANGAHIAYVFRLSRQTDGAFAGCWMNDGCVREQSAAPTIRDDT